MRLRLIFLIIIFLETGSFLNAQEMIELLNPSFEIYYTKTQSTLENWESCIISDYSPPDVHSTTKKYWGNMTQPFAGDSYIGMVVRPDTTFEQITQKLTAPLIENEFYSFEIYLALPQNYKSQLKNINENSENNVTEKNELVDFANPVKLQIWGFHDICDPGNKLAETQAVNHREWQKHVIQFQSDATYEYLAFIPYYTSDETYPGSILIDECSPIFKTDSTYQYSYVKQDIDSLFLKYASTFKSETESYTINQSFVKYFTVDNPTNYWFYDFSNPSFYSKRFIERSSYAPKITEFRYTYDDVLTDRVVFYQDAVHTSYYNDASVSSVKRYVNGDFEGKQKIYYPSGNGMIEFEATVDKTFIRKDKDNKNIFQFKQRIKNLNIASRDGIKMSKFKIPKDTDLGDISITPEKELVFYRTNGRIIDKMEIEGSFINSNRLLSIIKK